MNPSNQDGFSGGDAKGDNEAVEHVPPEVRVRPDVPQVVEERAAGHQFGAEHVAADLRGLDDGEDQRRTHQKHREAQGRVRFPVAPVSGTVGPGTTRHSAPASRPGGTASR